MNRLLSLLLCVSMLVLSSFSFPSQGLTSPISAEQGIFLQLKVNKDHLQPLYSEIKHRQLVTEKIDGYQVLRDNTTIGTLSLHQYRLATGDLYYFLRYLPTKTLSQMVQVELPITVGERLQYRQISYPNGLDFTLSTWTEPLVAQLGENLPTTSVYLDSEQGSFFFSYIDVFEKQTNGVKKERYEQAQPIELGDQSIRLQLPQLANHFVEQWGIISQEPLVDWQDQQATVDLRIADLNRVRKWGQEGPYSLTPSSYTPSSPTSFYMNPAQHIGEKFLRSTGARFFEDFALVSLYTAIRTQNERGYWYMTNQSNWIKEDYGIPSTYYDTRFSTDAGLFLVRGYHVYQNPEFLQAAQRYADFLVQFAETHHFATQNGGYLIWDYGHDLVTGNSTHVSLNHLVTEMNFLYEMYLVTERTEYLEVAEKIRLAVQDTEEHWKKEENGDLWYAYLVDGTFGLLDYPLLTLKDLRYSQQLIERVHGEKDSTFTYLIGVKEAYLRTNSLPLY